MDNEGFESRKKQEIFISTKVPNRLYGPPSLFTGFFPWMKSSLGVKLTIRFRLMPSLRMSGALPVLPLYAFML